MDVNNSLAKNQELQIHYVSTTTFHERLNLISILVAKNPDKSYLATLEEVLECYPTDSERQREYWLNPERIIDAARRTEWYCALEWYMFHKHLNDRGVNKAQLNSRP